MLGGTGDFGCAALGLVACALLLLLLLLLVLLAKFLLLPLVSGCTAGAPASAHATWLSKAAIKGSLHTMMYTNCAMYNGFGTVQCQAHNCTMHFTKYINHATHAGDSVHKLYDVALSASCTM